MYCYTVYGLNIELSLPLTLLAPKKIRNDDVDTFFEFLDETQGEFFSNYSWQELSLSSGIGISVRHSKEWISLAYSKSETEALTFYISLDGSKVVCVKPYAIPISDAESFILGPILGCVLRLRDRICLHASVMEFESKAFAFVGNKGAGKSTTAAALINAGAKLISDDVAVLNANDPSDLTVQAGYPGVRLLPSSLSAFHLNQDNYKRVVSGNNKRYVPLKDSALEANEESQPGESCHWRFQSKPCSLAVIYALGGRQNELIYTQITTLNKQAALMALAPHGYGRRILNMNERANEFKYISQLSKRIPIKSIHCPNKLALLNQIAEEILTDVSTTH